MECFSVHFSIGQNYILIFLLVYLRKLKPFIFLINFYMCAFYGKDPILK